MTAVTHYAFSYLLCSAAGFDQATALTSSLFALLPDIDHPESFIGRIMPGVSKYLQRKYGHRTVTHSVFAVIAISLFLSPALLLTPFIKGGLGDFYFASILAYFSHIFIDLFNRSGVRIFSPVSGKEYISFRTSSFRILVSSWQEYAVLFVIVFLAFTVSGQAFSITKSVLYFSKLIYKTYSTALKEYQDSSSYLCNAKIEYFNHSERKKVKETLPILNLYLSEAFLLRNSERFVLKKEDIIEIEIEKTDKRVNVKKLSGTHFGKLNDLPSNSYISGRIVIKNYYVDLLSSNFIEIKKHANDTTIKLRYALPYEITHVLNIQNEIKLELESLRRKLCSYQIHQLKAKEKSIKRKIASLKRKGFYKNYNRISRLTGEIKKIQSRIDTLDIKESSGADSEIQMKIDRLEKGFSVYYELFVYEL